MAGFQVAINGRFWVATEVSGLEASIFHTISVYSVKEKRSPRRSSVHHIRIEGRSLLEAVMNGGEAV